MDAGTAGGIIGSIIGVLGGVVGTYFGISSTKRGRERQFAIRCAILVWIAGSAFIALVMITPIPYKWILWTVYGIALTVGSVWINRTHARIRAEEEAK